MRIKQQLCDYGRRSDIPGFFQTIEYSFSPAVSSTVSVLIVGRKHTLYHLKIDKPIIFRYEIMSVYVGGEPYLHNRIQVIINKFSYHGIFHYYFTIFHYLLISYTNCNLCQYELNLIKFICYCVLSPCRLKAYSTIESLSIYIILKNPQRRDIRTLAYCV